MSAVTLERESGQAPPRTVEGVHADYRLVEPWAQALYEHDPVVFDLSRAKLVGLGAVGAFLAILGLLLVGSETGFGVVMASLCILMGTGIVARNIRLLAVASGTVQVDSFGVRIRPGHQEHAWRDLLGANHWRQSHNHFVGLVLTHSARSERFAHRSTTYRRFRRVLTRPHGEAVVVLPHPLAVDRERFAHWLCMEAVYRNPELRGQAEIDLAQGVSPQTGQR